MNTHISVENPPEEANVFVVRVALTGIMQVVAPLHHHLLQGKAPLQVGVQEVCHWLPCAVWPLTKGRRTDASVTTKAE